MKMHIVSEELFTPSRELQDEMNSVFDDSAASEEALVAAAKSGSHLAFGELWKRYSNTAFKTVYRIVGNRDDAEDAIQDAWMKAYMHLNTFSGRAKFSSWLTRIAINSALMILRRKRAHPETSMDWSIDGEKWQQREVADNSLNIEELYLRTEAEWELKRAIQRLRPALRSIIEIQQSSYRSTKEIADLAGISVAATKSRLLRARTVLRRSLHLQSDRPLSYSVRVTNSREPNQAEAQRTEASL
jgi:RNA polymerase sigma factor (sigma-70 family)